MKSAKVLKILHVSRQTLVQYVKKKEIRVISLPNGTYDYNDDDVYRKAGLAAERMNVVYSRVSTAKQKTDLDNQEKTLIDYCNKNGVKVSKSYKDIASGMNFDRKQFKQLLDEILNFKVSRLYITYKDRLSLISFDMFKRLFSEFGCEIIVINDTDDKANETEIFEEIISMLHCFAMRMYSRRRKKKLEIMEEDLRLVYKFYIRHTEELDRLFQISNNLYNQALYLFRQHLDTDGTWLWYNDMDKLMKKTTNLEGECNYKLLKSQCSQQILRVLDKNIKAYCKSIKDWKKHPEKYKGMPKMLHYRKRGGMFNLYYTNQSCSIKDGRIRLAKDLFISVPQWEKYGESLKSVHQV